MAPDTAQHTDHPLSLQQRLVRLNIAAGFAAAFTAITGTVLTRYAQSLDMPPFGFGLLAALPFLMALVQIPASYAVERYGHRRIVAIGGILVHRAFWLAIAAVPWIVPRAWWWLGLLAFMAFSHASAHIGTPASTSWAADLVPSRIRGRYYAVRGQFARIINVPICLLIGWLMDHAAAHGLQTLLQMLSGMLALSAVLGMTDSLLCLALPDPWHRPWAGGLRLREIVRQPLANRNFRFYLGYTAFITFATGYIGPFVWLYLVDVVKLTNTEAVIQTMVGTSVISLLGMRFWGEKVDQWGFKRAMLIGGIFIINGASAWACITPATKWIGYLPVLISSFAWPAMELAAANLLFSVSETKRDGSSLGSSFIALNSAVVAVAGTLSGIFGGWMAQLLAGWHTTIFGWTVTFHIVLFFISAFFRIIALLWVLGMADDHRKTARQPVVTETAAQ
ncbi:MAG: MFS transporter [Armatimonadota bacterium]